MRYHVESLAAFCVAVLVRSGMNPEDSRLTSEALVTTDAWGSYNHGTVNLLEYVRHLKAGNLAPDALPELDSEGPAWARVNGKCAIGEVAAHYSMQTAMAKARKCGIGYVGLRNSGSVGAGGFLAFQAADEGLIGMVMSHDVSGRSPLPEHTSSPGKIRCAYAIPMRAEPPLLFEIPGGASIGNSGVSSLVLSLEDSTGFPFLANVLSSVLTGASIVSASLNKASGDSTDRRASHGSAFLAIDVESIMHLDEFHQRLSEAAHEIRSRAISKGNSRIILPGEKEWQLREEALHNGIPLPIEVVEKLKLAGEEAGIPLSTFF
ncbi:MAG: Ldh family oxidoreductase [Verrucomicrobiales bacterium]